MCSELENSGIRVAVGDCSITERRRWHSPYQTGKSVHVHAKKHYKYNENGRTVSGVRGHGSVLLSHSGNVIMRNGLQHHMADVLQMPGTKMLVSMLNWRKKINKARLQNDMPIFSPFRLMFN